MILLRVLCHSPLSIGQASIAVGYNLRASFLSTKSFHRCQLCNKQNWSMVWKCLHMIELVHEWNMNAWLTAQAFVSWSKLYIFVLNYEKLCAKLYIKLNTWPVLSSQMTSIFSPSRFDILISFFLILPEPILPENLKTLTKPIKWPFRLPVFGRNIWYYSF